MKQLKLDFNIFQYLKNTCVAALFTGAAILFFGCENNLEEIKAFTSNEDFPIVEATHIETVVTDSGQVRFNLKAPKLLEFENEGKTYYEFPEGMELVKYDENHEIISSITADYAKNFVKENKWEAKNNVIATNSLGDTLKTEHLIYDVENEKIYTEEFVKIIRADQIITGIGFVSDQKMLNWKIKNPKGTIYVEMDENNKPINSTESNSKELNREPKQPDKPLEFKQK